MSDPTTVSLVYTANIAGDLALLPRMATLIQRVRGAASGPVLALDLGDTCDPDVWICRATQGRAPFLVLDSMGYDGAVIGGPERVPIPPLSLRQLAGHMIMPVFIWNRSTTLTHRGIRVAIAPGTAPDSADTPTIRIDRTAAALPEIGSPVVCLGDVPHGHLAHVELAWPGWTVQAAQVIPVTHDTPVDPTISAVVELVESEAHTYAREQGGTP